jgi:hypothetical protein
MQLQLFFKNSYSFRQLNYAQVFWRVFRVLKNGAGKKNCLPRFFLHSFMLVSCNQILTLKEVTYTLV